MSFNTQTNKPKPRSKVCRDEGIVATLVLISQTSCSLPVVRRVEKVANQRHGLRRPLFHQPMSGASNDHLSNIGRHVAHDHRLHWTKRLLSAYSQYGHGQLHLLEDFVVLRVLRKSGELSEPSPHPTWLRIGGRKKVSGGLIGLGGIAGEIIPYAIEVDALTTGHKPFGVRPVKVEMQTLGSRRISFQGSMPGIGASSTTNRSTLSGYIAAYAYATVFPMSCATIEALSYPSPVTTARMSLACVFSSYPASGFDDFPIPRRSGTTTV